MAALGERKALASIAGATRFTAFLDHPVPLVRAAAVCLQRGAPETQHPARVAALLGDRVKTVFIVAVGELLSLWIARMPDRASRDVNEATRDLQGFLLAKAGFPNGE